MPAEVVPPSKGDRWTGVVVHEAESITAAMVEASERLTGPGALHVRSDDAGWPERCPDREQRPIPSARSDTFLDTLAPLLDHIASVGRRLDPAATAPHGVDLPDVAFYEWLYASSAAAHRAWALHHASEQLRPDANLVWVAAAPIGARTRSALERARPGTRVIEPDHLASDQASRFRTVGAQLGLGRARRTLGRLVRTARSLGEPVRALTEPSGGLVLLVDQYPHTARILAGAAAPVAGHPGLDVLHVGTDPSVAAAGSPWVPAVDLWSVAPLRVRRRAVAAARRASRVARRSVEVALGDADTIGLGPFAAMAGPDLATAAASTWGDAARHQVLVEHLLATTRPAVVVTTSLVASSVRAAGLAARRDAAPPVIWLQHGIVRTPRWKTRYVQSHFLVWGERDKRKLVAAGVDAEVIDVCGSSQFEAIATHQPPAAAADETRDEPARRSPSILYLPSRSGGNLVSREAARRMLDLVVSARPAGARVVVKPHPGDASSTFDDVGGPEVEVRVGADLIDEITDADVVVVATSTAGLEACAVGRPVIALALPGISVADEYVDYGAALLARDLAELQSALTAALHDADTRASLAAGRRRLVDDLFHGLRPGAARRITDALTRQTQTSRLQGSSLVAPHQVDELQKSQIGAPTTGTSATSPSRPARGAPRLVSVVIPVLDGATSLPVQLAALAAQDYTGEWEVVVADNGSVDGTPDVARSWTDRLPRLRVIDASESRGINPARNAGVAAAEGDLVLICDADDEADPGWVRAMAAAAPGADLLGGRLDERSLNDDVVATWRPHNADTELPVALRFLPFAVGANCGAWADVIRAVGGFDPAYRRGAADVEFFWRAQLAGHHLAFVPDAIMHYRHRPGMKPLAKQFWKYGMADAQLYRAFRPQGMPRDSGREVLRAWRMIAIRALRSRDPEQRGTFVRTLAYRAGRVRGSVRQRVRFF